MAYVPEGLNSYQDVYVIGRGCDIPQTPCRLRLPPKRRDRDIHPENWVLHVRGWALDRYDSSPVSKVELFLDAHELGDADLNEIRPDLAQAFGHGTSVLGGWSFSGDVSDNLLDALWLTAWIQDRRGIREFLLAKNEPRTTACH